MAEIQQEFDKLHHSLKPGISSRFFMDEPNRGHRGSGKRKVSMQLSCSTSLEAVHKLIRSNNFILLASID